jgi:uncharacterized membrane protein
MTNETLTKILIILLSVNFALWIAFLVFLYLQVRKIFKTTFSILDDMSKFSSSMVSSAMKIGPLLFGLFKSFQAVKSITTLKGIFDGDAEEED